MLYVKQEKPVTTNHEKLGKIEFEVEVPQAQNLSELTQMAGGEQNLVEFVNGQIATNAKNAARAYARNFTVPELKDGQAPYTEDQLKSFVGEIETKGQTLARDYSPATDTERGPSKAKKAAAFDQVAALVGSGQEFTREQLMELLQKVQG